MNKLLLILILLSQIFSFDGSAQWYRRDPHYELFKDPPHDLPLAPQVYFNTQNQRLDSIVTYMKFGRKWKDHYHVHYVYNLDNNNIREYTMLRKRNTQELISNRLTKFDYDNNNHLILRETSRWDTINMGWSLIKKDIQTFSEHDELLSTSRFKILDHYLYDGYYTKNKYDEKHRQVESTVFKWDKKKQELALYLQTEYMYDDFDLRSIYTEYLNDTTNTMDPYMEQILSFYRDSIDGLDVLETFRETKYLLKNETFYNKDIQYYNSKNQIVNQDEFYTINSSSKRNLAWHLDAKTRNHYDKNGLLIRSTRKDKGYESEKYIKLYKYDTEGHLIYETNIHRSFLTRLSKSRKWFNSTNNVTEEIQYKNSKRREQTKKVYYYSDL